MKFLFIVLLVLINSLFSTKIIKPKHLEEVEGVVTDQFKANALAQSYAGRAFLTWPNKDANKELSDLCGQVAKLVTKLKLQFDDEKCQYSVYRSNTKNGATGGATADVLAQTVARVATENATPNDRMVCITTMGDIAQAMVDSQVKTEPKETAQQKDKDDWKCLKDSYTIIAEFLNMDTLELSKNINEFNEKRSGNSMTKKQKKTERDNDPQPQTKPKNFEYTKRSGIYNRGPDADSKLEKKELSHLSIKLDGQSKKSKKKDLKHLLNQENHGLGILLDQDLNVTS